MRRFRPKMKIFSICRLMSSRMLPSRTACGCFHGRRPCVLVRLTNNKNWVLIVSQMRSALFKIRSTTARRAAVSKKPRKEWESSDYRGCWLFILKGHFWYWLKRWQSICQFLYPMRIFEWFFLGFILFDTLWVTFFWKKSGCRWLTKLLQIQVRRPIEPLHETLLQSVVSSGAKAL